MRRHTLPNASLIALAASYFIQIGAGVFALAIVGRVLIAAPPRSLAMLQGPHGYDGSVFWQVWPAITGALFLLTLITNWKTDRRNLVLGAFIVFAVGGALTVGWLGPIFAEVAAAGYRDVVDPALQQRAARWYAGDWALRCLDAAAGVALLVALTRPFTDAARVDPRTTVPPA